MSEPGSRQLDLTPGALGVIAAMQARVAAVAEEYGEDSPEHAEIAASLANALARMLQLGGRITKDDDLSLFGASHLAYGVIFFPRHDGGKRHPYSVPGRCMAEQGSVPFYGLSCIGRGLLCSPPWGLPA
jgi:hypothetical protein